MLEPVGVIADVLGREVRPEYSQACAILEAVVAAAERHDAAELGRLAGVAMGEGPDAATAPTGRRRAGRSGLALASLRAILRRFAGPGGWVDPALVVRRLGHVRFRCSAPEVVETIAALGKLGELERDGIGRLRLIEQVWTPRAGGRP